MGLNTHSHAIQARVRELEEARHTLGRRHTPEQILLEEAARLLHVERHANAQGICDYCATAWPCPVAVWHQTVTKG